MISFKKILLFLFFISTKVAVFSQCAMCKATLESDLAAGGPAGKGINDGIIYLMFFPYILMGVAGYLIYRHYKKNNQTEQV